EFPETVVLTLASSSSAYFADFPSSATVTIFDDEPPPPTITVVATDAVAAEPGTNTGTFTIVRSGVTSFEIPVFFTLGGTATNGVDYVALTNSVTILTGMSSTNITVIPIDDSIFQGTQTIVLTLATNVDYVIGSPSQATITILDDEIPPPVVS